MIYIYIYIYIYIFWRALQGDREDYIAQENDGKKIKFYIYRYKWKSKNPLH